MKHWICSIFLAFLLIACSGSDEETVQDIHAVMTAQSEAWNNGDLEAYMVGYWESDALRFSSGNTITFGYQATLHRYVERYPDRATMGKLTFSDLRTELLGPQAAFTTGAWHLAREEGDLGGRFTLVWRKINEEWRIVADHSS